MAADHFELLCLDGRIAAAAGQEVPRDSKTQLQELVTRHSKNLPRYQVYGEGPDHEKRFHAEVYVQGMLYGQGEGRSKKGAEQAAAAVALERLEQELRQLQERERQLQAILDVLPLPVFIADRTGRMVTVNPAVREFWGEGAPTPDHPGQYAEYKGWWPDGRRIQAREWALARAVEAGEIVGPEELEIETFNGERRTILNYARPIPGSAIEQAGAVAINVDITERKAHEESERFLADAGRTFASTLDYELTLRQVARLAVSRIADSCIVYLSLKHISQPTTLGRS
jgi:PAS domain S-box-containing protein